MNYLSVCSGIEAASVAWHPLGWNPIAFSEIEKFPAQLLAHHYPQTPNWGDMTKFKEWPDACICGKLGQDGQSKGSSLATSKMGMSDINRSEPFGNGKRRNSDLTKDRNEIGICGKCGGTIIDVLVGGTPCQSFSVAGLRKGLDDPRGNLMLTYLAIADRYRPEWVVWENVPGVLSSNGGRDFASFLRGLAELGYGFAYRILDAQYLGVAQRRRRVFVVGHIGDWQRAAAVLFERHSLQGHPAPRREAGKRTAASLVSGSKNSGGIGMDNQALFSQKGDNLVRWPADIAPALDTTMKKYMGLDNQHINGGGDGLSEVSRTLNAGGMGRQDWETETLIPTNGGGFDVAHSLRGDGFDASEDGTGRGTPLIPVTAPTLTSQVRRLTPRECERLQGFPDDYTLVQHRNKPAADGPRYKALGNSRAVPVMRWIGERIKQVEGL